MRWMRCTLKSKGVVVSAESPVSSAAVAQLPSAHSFCLSCHFFVSHIRWCHGYCCSRPLSKENSNSFVCLRQDLPARLQLGSPLFPSASTTYRVLLLIYADCALQQESVAVHLCTEAISVQCYYLYQLELRQAFISTDTEARLSLLFILS